MIKEFKTFFKAHKFTIILLTSVFLFRVPSLFEPYWYGDENIYLTVGMGIRKGFLLYRDIFDNKPPVLYLIASIANGSIFWFKFFLLVSMLTATSLFHRLAKIIFEKNSKAIIVSTIIFSLLTTLPFLEGNIVNAELFILLPTILGFYLFFNNKIEKTHIRTLIIGVILSIGFLLKVPAVFDFLTLLIFGIFLFETKKLISIKKQTFLILLGFIIPVAVTGIFFWLKGSFSLFFNSAFVQTMGYLSSWETGSHSFSLLKLLKSELSIKAFGVFFVFLLLWLKGKKLNRWLIFSALWFVFSFFGVTLSGRPYAHYLIQVIPSFCLLLGFLFAKERKFNIILPLVAVLIISLSFVRYRFWVYSIVPYYQNFLAFSLGAKDKNAYYAYFNPLLPEIYEVAEFISANTKTTDKIFVWADEPSFYCLSKRLPATPYISAYHILDLGFSSQTVNFLDKQKPAIIVVNLKTKRFPILETILKNNYIKLQEIGDFVIFRQRILLAPIK